MRSTDIFKRTAAAALACVTAVCCMPLYGYADTVMTEDTPQQSVSNQAPSLWADGDPKQESKDQYSIDVVRWLSYADKGVEVTKVGTASKSYYLLLPTTADLSALTLWHNFSEDPVINGITIKNGEKTDAIKSTGEYKMTVGETEYKLTVVQSQNIGSMYISTATGKMNTVHANKENKESGTILVVEADGTQDYNGKLSYIKGRGNTTWKNIAKKPYNIKLDKKAGLFGMDTSKKWCLLANGQDHSMLRNKIAFDLADELGLEYSPDSQYTDLYLNGEYAGVYQLSEKVEEGKNNLVKINDLTDETEKVNDKELDTYPQVKPETTEGSKKYFEIPNDPDDITGGYLLEFDVQDKYDDEASGFVTNAGQCVVVKGPEIATKAQIDYISSFVQDMEDAILSDDGKNSKGKHYSEYIDEESAALMYLIQEYSLNIDAGVSSCFFYKDSDAKGDGKIHASPAWDFDVAFGNLTTQVDETHTLTMPDFIFVGDNSGWRGTIFSALCEHKSFRDTVKRLFNEKFKPAIEILNSDEIKEGEHIKSLPYYRSILEASGNMNFVRWRIKNNRLVPGSGSNFGEQVDYLKKFTTERAAFFDEYFNNSMIGDDLNIYFFNSDEWEKVYVYYLDGANQVDWPGVEMHPMELRGLESLYTVNLADHGEKDTGDVRVIINNGEDIKTKSVLAKNNIGIYYHEFSYTDENGNEITDNYTGHQMFDESKISAVTYVPGDVDCDGTVTSNDALKILRLTVRLDEYNSYEQYRNSFVDSDDEVTSADALCILRYCVGIDDKVKNIAGDKLGELATYYTYDY